MRQVLNREYWSGSLGLGRAFTVVCATWTIVAALVGATGSRLFVPLACTMVGLAFIAGHNLGRKQP
ncbi:MAG TPA: hypothetical protein VLU92_04325 [Candidatus Dormibacteraeota bacterium]|nr:hypothetical protein [Candidatus Dormibacteraeota bacterium]